MEAEVMEAEAIAPSDTAGRGGKYLTFRLDEEEYGFEILRVREIIGLMPITAVPRTPAFIRGVVNLRGRIVPVLDLRQKFGMGEVEHTELACIVVVETQADAASLMGVLVDSVSEVVNIVEADIEDAPDFGAALDTGFILGMSKRKGSVRILLDIEAVLAEADVIDVLQLNSIEPERAGADGNKED